MKLRITTAICALAMTLASPAHSACKVADISIKSIKAKFVNVCKHKSCMFMKGVAVMNNGCSEAIGVQIKIIGHDKAGAPVSAKDTWPASVQNIPPGEYVFSLDTFLDYDAEIRSFSIQPIQVKRW